jgi:hypothetical protein
MENTLIVCTAQQREIARCIRSSRDGVITKPAARRRIVTPQ